LEGWVNHCQGCVLAGVFPRLVLFCAGCLAWFLDAILIFCFDSRVCL
jgi:hypothetical protein